jgi:hypothetical protein
MESRGIHGEGVAHEQDYIRERLEDAGDVDEYTEDVKKLKQEERDLERLEAGPARPAAGADQHVLDEDGTLDDTTARLPEADLAADGHEVPQAAARDVITQGTGGGAMGSSAR